MTAAAKRHTFLGLAIVAACLGVAMILTAQNLRLNLSTSMPKGLWWVTADSQPRRGDFVTICLPGDAGRLALARGYITRGMCADELEPILKPVVAVAGDVVIVSEVGIKVNDVVLTNSAPFLNDTEGRPMTVFPTGQYVVEPGMIWVVAGHDPRSYDSRYFGPVETAAVTGTARAVWTP